MTRINDRVCSSKTHTPSLPLILEALARLQQHTVSMTYQSMYVYDLVNQSIVYSTNSVLDILGYQDSNLEVRKSVDIANLIHPDDLNQFSQHWSTLASLTPEQVITLEYRMKGADGEYHWLRSHETTLVQATNGYPLQVLGIIQDVTDCNSKKARTYAKAIGTEGVLSCVFK